MQEFLRSWMIGCAVALVCTAATIGLRFLAGDLLDQPIPLYLSLVVAVFAAAALGGLKSGLLATAFCSILAMAVLPNAPDTTSGSARGRFVVFLMEGLAISGCFEVMQVDRRRTHEKKALLEEEVAERKHIERELVAAEGNKNRFLATLAHELRNPLAPIRNCLELMRKSPTDQAQLEYARGTIERQVTQMVRLVDDLLDVSRISRNKIELRKARVALADIIQQAQESCQPQIEAAGHHLTINMPSRPIWLEADPVRLIQVFANLLNNAVKYTGQNGHICLTARCTGGQVEVSLRDDGVGIPPDMLTRVFEMFTQLENGIGLSQGGLGVGLSLVRKLVELHGGTVEAHSEGHNRGSEFVIRLPSCAETPALAPHSTMPTPHALLEM